jgi:hypothetical protein
MRQLKHPTRILLIALVLGIAADQLFYGRGAGVSVPLFVVLGLAALAWLSAAEERRPERANLWVGASALFFALCLAWRDAPLLTALNLLAVLGLLVLLAASWRGEPLARQPEERALGRVLAAVLEIAFRPAPLVAHGAGQVHVERAYLRRIVPVGRGLALATPALALFTALLMAADSVFASYVTQALSIDLPFDLASVAGHALLALSVAWACAGGLLVALLSDSRSAAGGAFEALLGWLVGLVRVPPAEGQAGSELPAEGATQPLRAPARPLISLGLAEGVTVLALVDALFGGFMLIQGAYFFGGLDTLARTGMTYAEYARRGFFELLAVACLALGMLCALAVVTRRKARGQRVIFNTASAAMIALVLGLLASAFQRMLLYEDAYGFTQLRLYTHSFMIWLAAVLGLFLLALLRGRPRLFSYGVVAAALIYLAALNIANPDALIVRENVARYQAGGKVDAYYLAGLSADATPDVIQALPALDRSSQETIVERLGYQRTELDATWAGEGWPSWNLGRARALAALEAAGIGPARR